MEYKEGFLKLEERVIQEIEKTLRQITLKIAGDATQIIVDENAVGYNRQLYRNIRQNVFREAGRIIGVVGVGANVPYGIFRHEGTRPHFPPIEPIQRWVIYKGLVKNNNRVTTIKAVLKNSKKGNKKVFDESRQIAFLIARKISQKGTKGLPFLKLALEQNREFIQQKLSEIKI